MGGAKRAQRDALAGDAAPPGPGEVIVRAVGVNANQVEVRLCVERQGERAGAPAN